MAIALWHHSILLGPYHLWNSSNLGWAFLHCARKLNDCTGETGSSAPLGRDAIPFLIPLLLKIRHLPLPHWSPTTTLNCNNYMSILEAISSAPVAVQICCWALFALVALIAAYKCVHLVVPLPRNQASIDFRDKVVLLTGASSGIGREMARQLHAKGARLVLASRAVDQLEKLCAELREQRPHHHKRSGTALHDPTCCRLDLEECAHDEKALAASVARIRALLPEQQRLDILVNNAGQQAFGSCRQTDMGVLRRMLDVNFLGHVALTQVLMDLVPDDGAIVAIGSIVGRVALPYMGAYSASKHALQAFFDSMRAEERPQLQILTVSPGYVNTELGQRALNERGGIVGKKDPQQVSGMSAEYAAKQIVRALQQRETELLLAPFVPRLLLSLRLFVPDLMWKGLHQHFEPIYGSMGKAGQ